MSSRGVFVLLVTLLFAVVANQSRISALTVTNTNDDGPGSLREAIALAAPGETIEFSLSGCPCTIALTSGQLTVDKSLAIIGPKFAQLTISGTNSSRVFLIQQSPLPDAVAVTLERLRITGGRTPTSGGGIFSVNANLTIRNSVIAGNVAGSDGGGIYNSGGMLSVISSRIADNQAIGGSGGGIASDNFSELVVRDSTVSNNNSFGAGGGISVAGHTTAAVVASTVDRNRADGLGAGINTSDSITAVTNSTISTNTPLTLSRPDSGGGIVNYANAGSAALLTVSSSTVTQNRISRTDDQSGSGILNTGADGGFSSLDVRNTIIAGNLPGQPDVGNTAKIGSINSSGFNLIGIVGSITAFNQLGDQVGTAASPIDPRLQPLASNGGPTQTHGLELSSPAVDRGNSFGGTADQRGVERPNDSPDLPNAKGGDGADIGAYEISFPVVGQVSIDGRVLAEDGTPLRRGYVTLTGSTGNVAYATINPFGYYRFVDVQLGQTVTLAVVAKGFKGSPRSVFVALPLSGLELTAAVIQERSPKAARLTAEGWPR